jgi:hypothetical protein
MDRIDNSALMARAGSPIDTARSKRFAAQEKPS